MKFKKLIAMALAFAMALTLAVPAFAEEPDVNSGNILKSIDKVEEPNDDPTGILDTISKKGFTFSTEPYTAIILKQDNTTKVIWTPAKLGDSEKDTFVEELKVLDGSMKKVTVDSFTWIDGDYAETRYGGEGGFTLAVVSGMMTLQGTISHINFGGNSRPDNNPDDDPGKVSATFQVTKEVVGDTKLDGFTFAIYDSNNALVGTMTSNAAGAASAKINLAPGNYTIVETNKDLTKYEDNTQVLTATVDESGRVTFAADAEGMELNTFTNVYKLGKLDVTGSVTKIWDKEFHKLVYQTYSEGTLVSHIAPQSGASLPEGITGSYLKNGMTYLTINKAQLAAAGEDGVTIGIAQSDPQKGNKTSWNTPAPAPKGEDDQPTYNLKIVDGKLVVTSELPNIGVRLYSAKESPKGPSDFKGKFATKGHLTGATSATFDIPKGDTFKLFLHIEDTSYETNAVIGCEVSMIGKGMQNVGKDVTVEVSRVVEDTIYMVGTYSLLNFATLEDLEADTYTVTLIYNGEVLATMECVVTAGQTATADFGYVTVVGEKEIVCPYVDNLGGPGHGIFPDYPLYEAMPIAD